MRAEYDFSKGKRGAVIPQKGKTRISIFIDNAILAEFRARAEKAGTGYQTMMNEALRAYLFESGIARYGGGLAPHFAPKRCPSIYEV